MTGRWPDFLEVHRPGGVGLWLSLRIPVMPSPPCHRVGPFHFDERTPNGNRKLHVSGERHRIGRRLEVLPLMPTRGRVGP